MGRTPVVWMTSSCQWLEIKGWRSRSWRREGAMISKVGWPGSLFAHCSQKPWKLSKVRGESLFPLLFSFLPPPCLFSKGLFWKLRLPWWFSGKESTCQCKRCGFSSCVGKIPWRRKWQRTPGFLPGKSHGQRSLEGYSPWGCKELDRTYQLNNIVDTCSKDLCPDGSYPVGAGLFFIHSFIQRTLSTWLWASIMLGSGAAELKVDIISVLLEFTVFSRGGWLRKKQIGKLIKELKIRIKVWWWKTRTNTNQRLVVKAKRKGLTFCSIVFIFQIFYLSLAFFFFFFGLLHIACGILVSWQGIKSTAPAAEVRSLDHWTAREVPFKYFIFEIFLGRRVELLHTHTHTGLPW